LRLLGRAGGSVALRRREACTSPDEPIVDEEREFAVLAAYGVPLTHQFHTLLIDCRIIEISADRKPEHRTSHVDLDAMLMADGKGPDSPLAPRPVRFAPMSSFDRNLDTTAGLLLRQRKELAELFGFETRNKYEIQTVTGEPLGFAAEQQKGVLGFLLRQFLGHWRSFELLFFDTLRNPVLTALHPFRWFFQRLEVRDASGRLLGALQRRFAVFSKCFDMEDARGHVMLTVRSPIWRPWTFTFMRGTREVAVIRKRWTGVLAEAFTDADTFSIDFAPGPVSPEERRLLLAASVFVDLMFFERKAQ
jgi:uncharacterized protein YxjI